MQCLLILLCLVFFCTGLFAQTPAGHIVHKNFPKKFHIAVTYTFPARSEYNTKPCTTWKLRMIVPVPATDEFHTVENLQAKSAAVKEFKNSTNRYAAYSFNEVPSTL